MSRALTALIERLAPLALAVRALDLEAERRSDPWFAHESRVNGRVAAKELQTAAWAQHGVTPTVAVTDDSLVPPLKIARQWIANEDARLSAESSRRHAAAAARHADQAVVAEAEYRSAGEPVPRDGPLFDGLTAAQHRAYAKRCLRATRKLRTPASPVSRRAGTARQSRRPRRVGVRSPPRGSPRPGDADPEPPLVRPLEAGR